MVWDSTWEGCLVLKEEEKLSKVETERVDQGGSKGNRDEEDEILTRGMLGTKRNPPQCASTYEALGDILPGRVFISLPGL